MRALSRRVESDMGASKRKVPKLYQKHTAAAAECSIDMINFVLYVGDIFHIKNRWKA